MIGPGGMVVIDTKQYRGRLQLDRSGRLWHGRYPLASALRAVSFEADQAVQVLTDPDVVVVVPVVAVHGARSLGQGRHGRGAGGGGHAPAQPVSGLPAVLGPERVAVLADQARVRFHAAA